MIGVLGATRPRRPPRRRGPGRRRRPGARARPRPRPRRPAAATPCTPTFAVPATLRGGAARRRATAAAHAARARPGPPRGGGRRRGRRRPACADRQGLRRPGHARAERHHATATAHWRGEQRIERAGARVRVPAPVVLHAEPARDGRRRAVADAASSRRRSATRRSRWSTRATSPPARRRAARRPALPTRVAPDRPAPGHVPGDRRGPRRPPRDGAAERRPPRALRRRGVPAAERRARAPHGRVLRQRRRRRRHRPRPPPHRRPAAHDRGVPRRAPRRVRARDAARPLCCQPRKPPEPWSPASGTSPSTSPTSTRAVDFQQQVIGMVETERLAGASYLTCNDRHHELILIEDRANRGYEHLALEVADARALDGAARRLTAAGGDDARRRLRRRARHRPRAEGALARRATSTSCSAAWRRVDPPPPGDRPSQVRARLLQGPRPPAPRSASSPTASACASATGWASSPRGGTATRTTTASR